MTLHLRPFRKDDLEPSFALWERTWRAVLPDLDYDAHGAEWRRRFTEEILPRQVVLAAELDGRLAALAVIDLPAARLDHLVVEPDCQGRGVGRALVEATRAILEGRRTMLRVLQANPSAMAFYEHLGFVRSGTSEGPTGWPCFDYVDARPG